MRAGLGGPMGEYDRCCNTCACKMFLGKRGDDLSVVRTYCGIESCLHVEARLIIFSPCCCAVDCIWAVTVVYASGLVLYEMCIQERRCFCTCVFDWSGLAVVGD